MPVNCNSMGATTAPDPIVLHYLYPDVAVLAGAGGVQKTTITLHEAIVRHEGAKECL
jgi:hypothetical protein